MPFRYAVLWDVDGEKAFPVGLAVQQEDHVLVDVPDDYCLAGRYREPYAVMQPDSIHVTYRPDDPAYFDQVLIDLSRTFAVQDQGHIAGDAGSIVALLKKKVLTPLIECTEGQYSSRSAEPRYRADEGEASEARDAGGMAVAV